MKKYIKLFGTSGSGKSSTAKEVTRILSGAVCDYWKHTQKPPIISFNQCVCKKHAILGKWKPYTKVTGIDCLRGDEWKTFQKSKNKPTFNFREKVESGQLLVDSDVIIEEGLVTYSAGIQHSLNENFELYTFYMDYPADICVEHYKMRGSEIGEGTVEKITDRIKTLDRIFDEMKVAHKYKLSGTIAENAASIIIYAGLQPCNCMQGFKPKIQKSLFDDFNDEE